MESLCGIDCNKCEMNKTCKGCSKTNGSPFGGKCALAKCINNKGRRKIIRRV